MERENAPAWAHGPALPVVDIEQHIRESARELLDYQAVRWALAQLKPGSHWPNVHTTWTRGSGDMPLSLTYDDCLEEACQLITIFQENIENVRHDRFRSSAQVYHERFTAESFLESHRYLFWFHGKDHLVQLCRRLSPNFPRRPYARWAAENVNIEKHPDLQQLVDFIKM